MPTLFHKNLKAFRKSSLKYNTFLWFHLVIQFGWLTVGLYGSKSLEISLPNFVLFSSGHPWAILPHLCPRSISDTTSDACAKFLKFLITTSTLKNAKDNNCRHWVSVPRPSPIAISNQNTSLKMVANFLCTLKASSLFIKWKLTHKKGIISRMIRAMIPLSFMNIQAIWSHLSPAYGGTIEPTGQAQTQSLQNFSRVFQASPAP